MSRRLRDQTGSPNPAVARAAELLRSIELDKPSAARRARVRLRIAERDRARARGPLWRLLPAAALFACAFGGAATAAWMADRPWLSEERAAGREPPKARRTVVREAQPVPEEAPPESTQESAEKADQHSFHARALAALAVPRDSKSASVRAEVSRPVARLMADVPSDPASPDGAAANEARVRSPSASAADLRPGEPCPDAPAPEESGQCTFRRASSGGSMARPTPEASRTAAKLVTAVHEDGAENVALAMEELRAHRDPKRAFSLLEGYRVLHPNGMLAEEALALAIEAASQFDEPRASALAAEYLARFPEGRFARLALGARAKD